MRERTGDATASRDEMIRLIRASALRLPRELSEAVAYPGVLEAMRAIPRELFVPEGERSAAYADSPLPIGHGQTISQPLMVAVMTGLLRPAAHHRVLEIGTGSGYQAAVLSRLVAEVWSVEVVGELARNARVALAALGITNVHVREGDGRAGWPEAAPFDGVIVTAAADDRVPAALVDQLANGGRLVAPVGLRVQSLELIEKDSAGAVSTSRLMPVRFVPLV